jgi:hypothetical protein
MKYFRRFLWSALALVFASQLARGDAMLKPMSLPSAEGTVVGTGFSPDSSRVAVVRYVTSQGASNGRHTIQTEDLQSGREISQADLPDEGSSYTATSAHFVAYSFDGRYILVASTGSDVLSIVDPIKLQILRRIVLHPETEPRRPLPNGGSRNFRGIVSLSVASNANVFGVLTHDGLGMNEIFTGSISSGQIIASWSLGHGRTSAEMGRTSLSLSEDGQRVAVSILPSRGGLPKNFKNLLLFRSQTGDLIKAIRTDGLIGQLVLVPGNNVLASRIDTPSLFSKKACIEEWNIDTGTLSNRFCDERWNVQIALGISAPSNLAAGFACKAHKDLEGNVYSVEGKIDVWNIKSGTLVASSEEIPKLRLISADLQISADGSWFLANQALWRVGQPLRPD